VKADQQASQHSRSSCLISRSTTDQPPPPHQLPSAPGPAILYQRNSQKTTNGTEPESSELAVSKRKLICNLSIMEMKRHSHSPGLGLLIPSLSHSRDKLRMLGSGMSKPGNLADDSFVKLVPKSSEYGPEAWRRFSQLTEGKKLIANIDPSSPLDRPNRPQCRGRSSCVFEC
jgi:hypothetical protein